MSKFFTCLGTLKSKDYSSVFSFSTLRFLFFSFFLVLMLAPSGIYFCIRNEVRILPFLPPTWLASCPSTIFFFMIFEISLFITCQTPHTCRVLKKFSSQDILSGPVAKPPCSQCRFNSQSGN